MTTEEREPTYAAQMQEVSRAMRDLRDATLKTAAAQRFRTFAMRLWIAIVTLNRKARR
jgi:hypothetical protein